MACKWSEFSLCQIEGHGYLYELVLIAIIDDGNFKKDMYVCMTFYSVIH